MAMVFLSISNCKICTIQVLKQYMQIRREMNNIHTNAENSNLNRYIHLFLTLILLVASVIRFSALMSLSGSHFFDFPMVDEGVYHDWAVSIVDSTKHSVDSYGFAPLPAYVMAGVYWIFSPDLVYIRILNVFLGVATCYFVYLIGKQLDSTLTALFSCLIASFYSPFVLYSIVPLKTASSIFLFAVTIYLFIRILDTHSLITALILGVVVGCLINVRPNSVIILPMIPLLYYWFNKGLNSQKKHWKFVIFLYAAGLLIAISPFTIAEYLDSGKLTLTTRQGGFALYIGNNVNNGSPYYAPVPFAEPRPKVRGKQMIIEASRRAGKPLTVEEASEVYIGEVLRLAIEKPMDFSILIGQKALAAINRFESGDHYHIDFLKRFVPFFNIPMVSFGLVLPFGITGLLITSFRNRRIACVGIITAIYASTLVIFFVNARFRVPLLIVLIPFSIICVKELIELIANRRFKEVGLLSLTIVIFFIISNLPVKGANEYAKYYNTYANILDAVGEEEQAIAYWEESAAMNERSSAIAFISLALKQMDDGNFEKAYDYLNRVPDTASCVARKYDVLGDLEQKRRNAEKAVNYYKKALEINSGLLDIRLKLLRYYIDSDHESALNEYRTIREIARYYGIHIVDVNEMGTQNSEKLYFWSN